MSGPPPRRRLTQHWAWLLAALLSATALAGLLGVFWRFDLSVYDAALPTGPAPSDVVIVAADDASIAELGRWPWPRAVHAALLDRLRALGARAVLFDIFFTEPDRSSPAGDAALAAAMTRGPPTVLPLLVEMPESGRPLHEVLPIPALAHAAAAMGYAHLELDRDGMVRSVFLRGGPGAPDQSYLALALLQSVAGAAPSRLPGERHPGPALDPGVWVRDYRMLIPFLGPPGHFAHVSYVDVLRGTVRASELRGKFVLVGVTAQGAGDMFPTPRSGQGQAMPGVEVTANVLQALRSGTLIRPVSRNTATLLALIPILLVAWGLQRLSPRQSLLLTVVLWLGTLGASVLALRVLHWWWPPSASLAALLAAYPLWSWRRLEATKTFLEDEFAQLANERFPLSGELTPSAAASPSHDVVQQRIELLRQATHRMRDVRRLFAETINSLPDATLLVDVEGRVVLANAAAASLFDLAENSVLEGAEIDALLFARTHVLDLRFSVLAARAPSTIEATLETNERQVLIRTAPFHHSADRRAGTIISLGDITELRAVQREREEVVRFLSHDIKSPATSLLGLAQLQRDPDRALPPQELSQRLDLLAQRMLTLVDSFVALARAESADPDVFDDFDLRDAVQDAYDEVWAAAQVRNIAIAACFSDDPCIVNGDRQLLARAIINLLGNAVKFSRAGTSVELGCGQRDGMGVVTVTDQGPGIVPASQAMLFRRFSRGAHHGGVDPGGAGLGLAFVRVVAEKHRGHAWVSSSAENGAVFHLSVPLGRGGPE